MTSARASSQCRVLVLGAHPDDAEFFAGGLLIEHHRRGGLIRLVSVTNGQSGHHLHSSDKLVQIRRQEAAISGRLVDSEYVTWDFPDGYLEPNLEVREAIIREIRRFQPNLVLTHRPWDYHPDHRAVGQAVQDASYMVMVPKIAPGHPVPSCEPVVAYMADLFTRPAPFRADFVLDTSPDIDRIVSMLACHRSQFAEWIPWIEKIEDSMPAVTDKQGAEVATAAWIAWLKAWYLSVVSKRTERFWSQAWGDRPASIEAFEISEYAGKLTQEACAKLFPNCRVHGGILTN